MRLPLRRLGQRLFERAQVVPETNVTFEYATDCSLFFTVDPPSSARDLSVVATSPGRIALEWRAPLDAADAHLTSYVVQYRDVNSSAYTSCQPLGADSCSHELTG